MDAIPISKKLIAFGSKKIYLPKFTVAFVRSNGLSPYHARFLVPLDFSKYDLRDYLYHAYNVKCFNIRSYVKQMPVRDTQEQVRHFFRPESKKYMTVEMEEPFVWPETPNLEAWGKEEREREIQDSARGSDAANSSEARDTARRLRDHVNRLLHKEVATKDYAIETKRAQSIELNKEELERENERLKRERELAAMSRLQLWEHERTGKVVGSDDASESKTKA